LPEGVYELGLDHSLGLVLRLNWVAIDIRRDVGHRLILGRICRQIQKVVLTPFVWFIRAIQAAPAWEAE
jgi:hypothetical protein